MAGVRTRNLSTIACRRRTEAIMSSDANVVYGIVSDLPGNSTISAKFVYAMTSASDE